LGVFASGKDEKVALDEGVFYAAACNQAAVKFDTANPGKCQHFTYNKYYPSKGCFCCIDTIKEKKDDLWDTFTITCPKFTETVLDGK